LIREFPFFELAVKTVERRIKMEKKRKKLTVHVVSGKRGKTERVKLKA
jgi:hypothetical protein